MFVLVRPTPQHYRLLIKGQRITVEGTPLRKAGDIPAGARWITVHAPGHEKGQPVLIQETEHGSGVFHVIGGAGGKLNYLKLHGVKDKGAYAQDVRDKQKGKAEAKKQQTQREKDTGVHAARQSQRRQVGEQRQKAEQDFVQTVSQKMGWTPEETAAPDVSKLSEPAQKRALAQHHRKLLARASEAANLARRRLVIEADDRNRNLLNEPEEENHTNLGYQPQFTERTKAQAADITEEAQASDAERRGEEGVKKLEGAKAKAAAIKQELAAADIQQPQVQAKLAGAQDAVEILKARQALKAAHKSARQAMGAIDRGEQKAYVLETGSAEGLDQKVKDEVEQDLRTTRTRAFLSEVGKVGEGDNLGRHLGVGAYNALNSVSLATAGTGIVDRDTVDVLGVAGAAQAMAARLRNSLSPADYQEATDALEAFHVDHYMQRSEEALREATELSDAAKEIGLGEAENGDDIAAASELNHRKRAALGRARQVLGNALGEMEAHAALLVAMKGKPDALKVPLGKMRTEDAIKRLRAIGLQRGDYALEHAGPEVIATVTPEGMERIAKPIDADQLRRSRDSLAIQSGKEDDPDFWPQGVARRPDLALPPTVAGQAPPLAEPFALGPDMAQSIRDYIGGRMAEGQSIGDIVSNLQSNAVADLTGEHRDAYFKELNALVPLADDKGKPIEQDSRRPAFERMADDFMMDRHGTRLSPLHSQPLAVNEHSIEALHRAFSEHPAGPLAFKPVGALSAQDQGALRQHFEQHIAKPDDAGVKLRADLAEHEGTEPEKETDDMFGRGTNPAWTAWQQKGHGLREKINESGLSWNKYTRLMGSPQAAYATVQDHLKGQVVDAFQKAHNQLAPDSPLRLGRTSVANHLSHLDAVDPAAREARLAEQRELVDTLRDRTAGRYAGGTVADRLAAVRERQAAIEQSQLGFFAAKPDEAGAAPAPLATDERATVGAAAEQTLARMAENVGQNFKPGQPVKMWQPSMTGKFVNQQRAIKLVERNKRLALAQGVGSGKTSMGLGAFAHLKTQGKIKRGLFLVPSIVQGQFGTEALKMLEPGKFKWHAAPGASREERMAAYRDPANSFSVVTHQSFRDDLIHMGAEQTGVKPEELSEKLQGMKPEERRAWAKDTMQRAGMDHDFLMVDEGHDLLNRKGKANSSLANVVDAVSGNMSHYVNATADPVKNDASEMFDVLAKMDPARYTDRASFLRRYGVDTIASRDALRREAAPYFYPGRIDAGVQVHAKEVPVELSDAQKASLADTDAQVGKLRLSQLQGTPDVGAARALSPESFKDQPESEHPAIAKRLAESAGILHETASWRAINAHEHNAKTDALSKIAMERKGKPGVVFARSRAAVTQLAQRLRDEGHRVVTITGSDSAKEKQAKRLKFRPESGEPEADILVASDAGAVGMNAQRGAWLTQFDTPLTAKTHAQRNGRINRLGQENPSIELMDLVGNHPQEKAARDRLKTKYALRDILTSPLDGLEDEGFSGYLAQAHAANKEAS